MKTGIELRKHGRAFAVAVALYVVLDILGVIGVDVAGLSAREKYPVQLSLLAVAIAVFVLLAAHVALNSERRPILTSVAVSCSAILAAGIIIIVLAFTVMPGQFSWDTEPIGVLGGAVSGLSITLGIAALASLAVAAISRVLRTRIPLIRRRRR